MLILIKIGLNPAELWPKPFLLGQLLFDFPCLLGQLLAGPSIRKPRQGDSYNIQFLHVSIDNVANKMYSINCRSN